MNISFDLITGLAFGVEYVSADEDADIYYPCVIIDIAFFRWVVEFTQ